MTEMSQHRRTQVKATAQEVTAHQVLAPPRAVPQAQRARLTPMQPVAKANPQLSLGRDQVQAQVQIRAQTLVIVRVLNQVLKPQEPR